MRRALLLLLALVLFGGCSDSETVSEVEQIQKAGVLRIGIDPGYVPFEMKTIDGQLIGFDIELARAIADSLGVKAEFRDVEWDGIIPALKSGDIDMICSGMSITPERSKVVLFSAPYYEIGQAVLLPADSEVTSVSQLNAAGRTITVQTGTTGHKAAQQFLPDATLKDFEKQIEAAMEVAEGRADGMVFDHPYIAIFHKRNPATTRALLDTFTDEEIGIALRPGAEDLKAIVDRTIEGLRSDGTMAKLETKYFVEMPWLDSIGGE